MTEEDYTQSPEIIEQFLNESDEYLQLMNQSLVKLEKDPGNEELLNDIFRLVHTLKSMCSTMGYERPAIIAHDMEHLFHKFRKKELNVTPDMIDFFLKCSDTLLYLRDVAMKGEKDECDLEPLLEELQKLLETPQGTPEAPQELTAEDADDKAGEDEAGGPDEENAEMQTQDEESPAGPVKNTESASAAPASSSSTSTSKTTSVRINIEHLDKLMNSVGELVINKARIHDIAEQNMQEDMIDALKQFDRIAADLQTGVLKTRLVPIANIFDRYPRMIRDLARKSGKEIEFEIEGADIEVDRMLLEEVNPPLVHLLRNAVDHGIEIPEERRKLGKPEQGNIKLIGKREKGHVNIIVIDDGRGFTPKSIRDAAVRKNFISREEADALSDKEAIMLICEPGFSTASEITDTSGRGVGMDAVKSTVEKVNGTLDIQTEYGEGTTFSIQVPLNMAIVNALLVQSGSEIYAVPLKNISETVRVQDNIRKNINKKEVLVVRDEVIPLFKLTELYHGKKIEGVDAEPYAVIVESDGKKSGIVVESLIGRREIVIKTLQGVIRQAKGFSGATILGDGKVVLIVDVGSII